MKLIFAQVLILSVFLPTELARCRQDNSYMAPATQNEETINEGANQTDSLSLLIKFKVSARGLTGRNRDGKMVKIDPFPKIKHNDGPELDEKYSCFIRETQNPNWNHIFIIVYQESSNEYLTVEVRDNVEGGNDFSLGVAMIQVRNMLCEGRTIESPLWNHNNPENDYLDEFSTGTVLIETVSVSNQSPDYCDL